MYDIQHTNQTAFTKVQFEKTDFKKSLPDNTRAMGKLLASDIDQLRNIVIALAENIIGLIAVECDEDTFQTATLNIIEGAIDQADLLGATPLSDREN